MERRDHASLATFFADASFAADATIELPEDAAQHARVRRLQIGDALRLTNGRGALAWGRLDRLTKSAAHATVDRVKQVIPLPSLRLFVPVADRDRMLWLAEKSAELAVSHWQPVLFRRSASVSPRGEGEAFLRKTRARMISALEQSGGAWLPEIAPELPLSEALVRFAATGERSQFLMDCGGAPLVAQRARAADAMVGPEGGLEEDERALIIGEHRWVPVSLGETTLRFETAGVLATGILRGLLAIA